MSMVDTLPLVIFEHIAHRYRTGIRAKVNGDRFATGIDILTVSSRAGENYVHESADVVRRLRAAWIRMRNLLPALTVGAIQ